MSHAKISVIVPCLEKDDGLRGTLESLCAQDMEDIEILCVGDVEKDPSEDRRFRKIRDRRKNCGCLLNRALEEAVGQYVMFLRPGDIAAPDMCGELARAALAGRLDILQPDVDGDGGKLSKDPNVYGHVLHPIGEQEWTFFPSFVVGGLYRSQFLREHGIRFSETGGRHIPSKGFRLLAFLRAGRACFLKQTYLQARERLVQAVTECPEDLFREVGQVAAGLAQDGGCRREAGELLGRICCREVLPLLRQIPADAKREFLEAAAACFQGLHAKGWIDYRRLAPEEHLAVSRILFDRDGYLEEMLPKRHSGEETYDHIFPYHLFREGETIAIYGAGDVGKKFYRQAMAHGFVRVVAIVDRNAEGIHAPGIPVGSVKSLLQHAFDSVLISITSPDIAREARETLIRMGIDESRVKWDGTIYWRDHFYRELYFPFLRSLARLRSPGMDGGKSRR